MERLDELFLKIYGFEFVAYSKSIGHSKVLSYYKVIDIPKDKWGGDTTPMFVMCHKCKKYMDYFYGMYFCGYCGRKVKEETLNSQLGREVDRFKFEGEDDYYEYCD